MCIMTILRNTAALILVLAIAPSAAVADGGVFIKENDRWTLASQQDQLCAINYKDGVEKMVLAVSMKEALKGTKAVWIFPVPALPDKVTVDVISTVPVPEGHSVTQKGQDGLELIQAMAYSPLGVLGFSSGIIKIDMPRSEPRVPSPVPAAASGPGEPDVVVHKSIEKKGMTTELISAESAEGMLLYLKQKGAALDRSSLSIIREYIGKKYSFTVSWISDLDSFRQSRARPGNVSSQTDTGGTMGIAVSFPTEKIFFPMRLTSVYGEQVVRMRVYVMGYVVPELALGRDVPGRISYRRADAFDPGDNQDLRAFFGTGERIRGLRYTQIDIETWAEWLDRDLWAAPGAPLSIHFMEMIAVHSKITAAVLISLLSCLSGLLAGIIVFSGRRPGKFALLGLWNWLTVLLVAWAVWSLQKKDRGISPGKRRLWSFVIVFEVVYLGLTFAVLGTPFPDIRMKAYNASNFSTIRDMKTGLGAYWEDHQRQPDVLEEHILSGNRSEVVQYRRTASGKGCYISSYHPQGQYLYFDFLYEGCSEKREVVQGASMCPSRDPKVYQVEKTLRAGPLISALLAMTAK